MLALFEADNCPGQMWQALRKGSSVPSRRRLCTKGRGGTFFFASRSPRPRRAGNRILLTILFHQPPTGTLMPENSDDTPPTPPRPGRRSAASLSVVAIDVKLARPEPPETLSQDEAVIWKEIVGKVR